MQMNQFRGRENDQLENISAFLIFLRGKWFRRRTQISTDMARTLGLSLALSLPPCHSSPHLLIYFLPSRLVGLGRSRCKGQLSCLSPPQRKTNVVLEPPITGLIEFNTLFLDRKKNKRSNYLQSQAINKSNKVRGPCQHTLVANLISWKTRGSSFPYCTRQSSTSLQIIPKKLNIEPVTINCFINQEITQLWAWVELLAISVDTFPCTYILPIR